MLDAFEAATGHVSFSAPRIPLVSNRTGEFFDLKERFEPRYWRHHTRDPVRFNAGIQTLAHHGIDIFLEVGPHSTLIEMGKRCLPNNPATWLASLQRGTGDWHVLLRSLAELFVRGAVIDWNEFDRANHPTKVLLPTYPFERRRHWVEMPSVDGQQPAPSPSVERSSEVHPLLGRRLVHKG
jgi:acyl transferase domain-containing protein